MYDKDRRGTIEMSKMVEVLETVYVMEGSMSDNMARDKYNPSRFFTNLILMAMAA